MSRRTGKATLVLALVVSTLGALAVVAGPGSPGRAGAAAPAAAGTEPPNVVVVMTDDQPKAMMDPLSTVRSVIGGEGVTFDNSFAVQPLCCPSRATFLTGQYPHNHGVIRNHPPNGGYDALRRRGLLQIWLRRAGYQTGYVGKFMNGYGHPDPREVPPGWDTWKALTGGVRGYHDYVMNENGRVSRYREYMTDLFADKASRFIRTRADAEPLFLTVAPWAPHGQRAHTNPVPAARHDGEYAGVGFPRSPSYNEQDVSDKPAAVRKLPLIDSEGEAALDSRWEKANESLLAVDELVADLIQELRSAGEFDNTLFIYTSDNGYLYGQHRLRAKTELYEESVQVPLVMRGPGVPSGVDVDFLAGNVDLAPTILDAAGAAPRRNADGRSLLPLVRNPVRAEGRELVLENQESVALRTPQYMYARHPHGERELYDLAADPYQLRSVHDDPAYREQRLALAERLAVVDDCAAATCP